MLPKLLFCSFLKREVTRTALVIAIFLDTEVTIKSQDSFKLFDILFLYTVQYSPINSCDTELPSICF